MASKVDLELIQGDDPTVTMRITSGGVAQDLTGKRVELLVKPTRHTADSAEMFRLSSVDGGISVTDTVGGEAVADFTNQLATAGDFWYRAWIADAADEATDRRTFAYGSLSVIPA